MRISKRKGGSNANPIAIRGIAPRKEAGQFCDMSQSLPLWRTCARLRAYARGHGEASQLPMELAGFPPAWLPGYFVPVFLALRFAGLRRIVKPSSPVIS